MTFGFGGLIPPQLAAMAAPVQQPLAQAAAGISNTAGPSAVQPALAQLAASSGQEPPEGPLNEERIQRALQGLSAVQAPQSNSLPAPPPVAPQGARGIDPRSLQALMQLLQGGGGGIPGAPRLQQFTRR